MDDEQAPLPYVSYNGLGRSPMIWGVPYMVGLAIVCTSLMAGLLCGTFVGRAGWLLSVIAIPLIIFVKVICTNDDKAVRILLLETKWTLIKKLSGNAKYHGGTLTISPVRYGRRITDVKRYFEKAVRG